MKIHTPSRKPARFLTLLLLACGGPACAPAAVTLPALISEHMVLQRSAKTALWGKAEPGEKVSATLGGVTAGTTAAPDGKWRLELDLSRLGPGPFDLVIAGTNKLTVPDVVIGEVWVASGQSNMEFVLSRTIDAAQEIAASANPQLRQFHVANNPSPTPLDDCKGNWFVAGPDKASGFSAVGYYFGKRLQQTLHVPVGLIHSSIGGTPVEAWMSMEALDSDPELKAGSERIFKQAADYPTLQATYRQAYRDWTVANARADKVADPAPYAAVDASTAGWKPVTLPGKLADAGLPDAGAIWVRKTVTLHGDAVKSPQLLDLGSLIGYETLYYNGKKVAEVTPDNYNGPGSPKRYYPGGSVEGENVIAIRIDQPIGGAGVEGPPEKFNFGIIPLGGQWLAKAEYGLPPLSDEARKAVPTAPKATMQLHLRPAALYNGMIHPLLPSTLAGAIWYQGEANLGRAYQYQTAFPLLIKDWRRGWGRELPFYFCQLPVCGQKKAVPTESSWAELREAQTKTLSLPNTGEAVLIDLGEAGDIHPRNKRDVGDRLAAVVLAKNYGRSVPSSGPIYASSKIEGDKIRVTFREVNGGLVARPLPTTYLVSSLKNETAPLEPNRPHSQLEGFAICGEDRKWIWADARIEGETVVVSNPAVPNPVAVRYAWADVPTVNLYNKAGLPAAPFRTDTFPPVTEKNRF